jgi:hypothetical protein
MIMPTPGCGVEHPRDRRTRHGPGAAPIRLQSAGIPRVLRHRRTRPGDTRIPAFKLPFGTCACAPRSASEPPPEFAKGTLGFHQSAAAKGHPPRTLFTVGPAAQTARPGIREAGALHAVRRSIPLRNRLADC